MNPVNAAPEFDPIDGYCGQCAQFEKSNVAPYGYCRAAPTLVLRARLRQENEICHFPHRFNSLEVKRRDR